MNQPFLKWPGSKRGHVDLIIANLPVRRRFYEPMCGSCAVALNVPWAATMMVGDINGDLSNLYHHLTRSPEGFIHSTRSFFVPEFNNADLYYEHRKEFNKSSIHDYLRAQLFVYLNKHCYNGLCRYNQLGIFNAPVGRYECPYYPEEEMRAFADWAKRCHVTFCSGDYTGLLGLADHNTTVYLDPPFWPLSRTANFTSYHASPFGIKEHKKLAKDILEAVERGVAVAVSNHDLPEVRDLYPGARYVSYSASRSISRDGKNRRPVQELLAVWGS